MHQKKTSNSWKILDKKYSVVVISTPRFQSWQTSGNLPQALQLIQAVGTCWRLFPFIRLVGSPSFSSKLYMELAVASSTTPHLNGQNLGALMLKHVKCKGIKLLYTKPGLDPSAYTRIHTHRNFYHFSKHWHIICFHVPFILCLIPTWHNAFLIPVISTNLFQFSMHPFNSPIGASP